MSQAGVDLAGVAVACHSGCGFVDGRRHSATGQRVIAIVQCQCAAGKTGVGGGIGAGGAGTAAHRGRGVAIDHAGQHKACVEDGVAVVGFAHRQVERPWVDGPVVGTARAQRVAAIAQRETTGVGFGIGIGR